MKKVSFYFLLLLVLVSCNSTKYVPQGKQLLTKNTIYIDSVKVSDSELSSLLLQTPNAKALGIKLPLYFYNIGNPNASKDTEEWKKNNVKTFQTFKKLFSEKQSISIAKTFIKFNNWFLDNGEAPVIINDKKIRNTEKNLNTYFFTEGYFRNSVTSKKDSLSPDKGSVTYYINKDKPSFINRIDKAISSTVIDSIYSKHIQKSFLKEKEQYKNGNFINEANRLIKLFRNNGIYHFAENNIEFNVDTLNNYQKPDITVKISDRVVEKDGAYTSNPFQIQKIRKINVFTNYSYALKDSLPNQTKNDNGISYFSYGKFRYKPKYLSQSIFLKNDQVYSDSLRFLTQKHLRSLKNFKTTSIRYKELNENELEANIYLTPTEKYTFGIDTELSRSNIRNFDVSTQISLINRNIFKGAEILKLALSGSYFNSTKGPGWELGANLSIEIPRFLAPYGKRIVPKTMFPKTLFRLGTNIQKNIALDRQNISASIDYSWQYNKRKKLKLELINLQYIRNLNTKNYFNIYQSEYTKLNEVNNSYNFNEELNSYDKTKRFMNTVALDEEFSKSNPEQYIQNANVLNRHNIITSDFLIPEIAFNYTYNNQENISDNTYSYFKVRVSNSGNFLGYITKEENELGKETLYQIPIAQYFKTDLEFKNFWEVSPSSILAYRAFIGAIFPYNNSNVPFSKSYYAGGSNDIRAWRTYSLGPGSRAPSLEYNIGTFKFLTSLEYRFNVVGSFKSALFLDAGNIWDITKSSFIKNNAKLSNFNSLQDIAVGSGFGIRYDLKFLVIRLDLGFKTYEPYLNKKRWFRNFNFSNAEYNIGINYPF